MFISETNFHFASLLRLRIDRFPEISRPPSPSKMKILVAALAASAANVLNQLPISLQLPFMSPKLLLISLQLRCT